MNTAYTVISEPKLKDKTEMLVHRAATVEFNNCSRGFTHEDVRSRNGHQEIASYSQESTRYVDYAKKGDMDLDKFQMGFILPYRGGFDCNQNIDFLVGQRHYSFSPQEFTDLIEGWYRALRKKGLKPEEARQWLPIGIKSQIVQTYNLKEWRYWFSIRCQPAAHPEIRFVACNLLKEFQERIPECFNDFEFSSDGESAIYKGNDALV